MLQYKKGVKIYIREWDKEMLIDTINSHIADRVAVFNDRPLEMIATQSIRNFFGGGEVSSILDIPVKYFKSTGYPQNEVIIYFAGKHAVTSLVFKKMEVQNATNNKNKD